MSEPALKCENNCAIFKQNYTPKPFIAFKMAYYCCFRFPPKKFYNIDYRVHCRNIYIFHVLVFT